MDHCLVSFAEAARRTGLPERTLRRWAAEGLLDRYWWSSNPRDKGPRVSLEQIQSIRAIPFCPSTDSAPSRSTPPDGATSPSPRSTPAAISGAVALWDAIIDEAAVIPDGLLVLTAGDVGKITRNDKGAWTYGPCSRRDLEDAGVRGRQPWEVVAARREFLPRANSRDDAPKGLIGEIVAIPHFVSRMREDTWYEWECLRGQVCNSNRCTAWADLDLCRGQRRFVGRVARRYRWVRLPRSGWSRPGSAASGHADDVELLLDPECYTSLGRAVLDGGLLDPMWEYLEAQRRVRVGAYVTLRSCRRRVTGPPW